MAVDSGNYNIYLDASEYITSASSSNGNASLDRATNARDQIWSIGSTTSNTTLACQTLYLKGADADNGNVTCVASSDASNWNIGDDDSIELLDSSGNPYSPQLYLGKSGSKPIVSKTKQKWKFNQKVGPGPNPNV